MDELTRKALVEALLKRQTTFEPPPQPGLLPLPEIPEMHQGKMFNLMSDPQRADGRASSLDFYLQPSVSPKGIGLNGAGLLYRKTW